MLEYTEADVKIQKAVDPITSTSQLSFKHPPFDPFSLRSAHTLHTRSCFVLLSEP